MDMDILDEQIDDLEDRREQQENNHKLYLQVMEIAQNVLSKTELDCFVFKYYSNYTNKEIQTLLGLSNINKVSMIILTAENKLKEATKTIKII
jgi:DNA-directed RNA polymerase specialized sigma24 family protein